MYLTLNHQKLEVYIISKKLVVECYRFSQHLPIEERFGMTAQIRRAALSVHLNIAEGSSRKSKIERNRYFEISRGSLVEIDAALDIADNLKFCESYPRDELASALTLCFKLLTGLITSNKS